VSVGDSMETSSAIRHVYLDERSLALRQVNWTPSRVYHVTFGDRNACYLELKLHIHVGKRGKLVVGVVNQSSCSVRRVLKAI
jgi:hypothetical protein